MSDKPEISAMADEFAAETREWLESFDALLAANGPERAHQLLEEMLEHARQQSLDMPFSATTGYVNSIEPGEEAHSPGNLELEGRLRAYMRWNAMAMVVKANRLHPEDGGDLGGHISSFASLAHMFAAGFNHFWHAANEEHGGDLLYIQGHSAPGVYARAFLEGRLSEDQLLNFRQEVGGKGLSSYPHPKLMPEFWQFPTVSMGLGPLMAIYQARFLKYLHARGIANTANRKVWVFCGDGEMDEPESLGAIGLAAREGLDNLIFVVNCNLQRLDGPVRGNGKIVQELEGEFRGAGWNVWVWPGWIAETDEGRTRLMTLGSSLAERRKVALKSRRRTKRSGRVSVATRDTRRDRDRSRGGRSAHRKGAICARGVPSGEPATATEKRVSMPSPVFTPATDDKTTSSLSTDTVSSRV